MCIVFAVVPVSANAQLDENTLAGCLQLGAQHFEIGILNVMQDYGTADVRVVRLSDGHIVHTSPVVYRGNGECGWAAYVQLQPGHPEPLPQGTGYVELELNTLYRIEIYITINSTRHHLNSFDYLWTDPWAYPSETGFFSSGRSYGDPDLIFIIESPAIPGTAAHVRVYPTRLQNMGDNGESGVEEFFSDSNWILPYDWPRVCAEMPNCANPDDITEISFLTPSQSTQPGFPRSYTTTQGADWHIPAGRAARWSGGDLAELRIGAGGRISASGTFHATGMTFTASEPAEGWLGVRYNAGSGGSLTDVTLTRVGTTEPPGLSAAVTIINASPSLTDVRVQDPGPFTVAGVAVSGASASPVITRLQALGLTDAGVSVSGDARVDLVRGNIDGNMSGVVASGAGSVAYFVPGAFGGNMRGPSITGNLGLGVVASSSAEVRFGAPSPQHGLASVTGNIGRGMTASSGGALYAGTATVYQRNHIFLNGGNSQTGNVRASGTGSRAYVQCNWWNTSTPTANDFRAGATSGGLLTLSRYLTADPFQNASPPCRNIIVDGSSTERSAAVFRSDDTDGTLLRRDSTLTARLLAAIELPTPAAAVEALTALVVDAPESEEAAAALGEIGGLAASVGAPATAVLDAATSQAIGALRVAAWQALVTSRAAQGDVSGAFLATDALIAEGAAVPGEAARVYLHVAAGDTTSAVAALERLEAAAPGSLEAAVARAFLGLGPDPFADGRMAAPETAFAHGIAPTSDGRLHLSPNPAGTAATLTLTLADASAVRVTVHDLLGRTVAQIASGVLESGTHRLSVPVTGLAPGVYVVRAVVGETISTVRLTVAR